jgi:malonyl CoA-acyl carrier protein transacylase
MKASVRKSNKSSVRNTDILPNSSFVDIVFYCGLTMQHTVERDEQGQSNYAMCAINPSHIGKTFNGAAHCEIINTISNGRDCLLEIVNFNVEVSRQLFFMSLCGN